MKMVHHPPERRVYPNIPLTKARRAQMIVALRGERRRLEQDNASKEDALQVYESFMLAFFSLPLHRRIWLAITRTGFPHPRKEAR